MKRSEINHHIKEAMVFFTSQQFYLPPWAYFSPAQWKTAGKEYQEIRDNCLGWDITDFGKGNFSKEGLTLFTIRNGSVSNSMYAKSYCEKIMMVLINQVTPLHFHLKKMQDLINRGGGDLVIELWKADANEKISDKSFTIQIDGVTKALNGGDRVILTPGESITLEPYVYHRFWAEKETALIGEISNGNDNVNDLCFQEPLGRFTQIEEDDSPAYLLFNEYPR